MSFKLNGANTKIIKQRIYCQPGLLYIYVYAVNVELKFR